MIDGVGRRRFTAFSGDRLASARHEHNWSRARLAAELDVSLAAVAAWERGDRAPEPAGIAALATALGIGTVDLVDAPPQTWTMVELRVLAGLRQVDVAASTDMQADKLGRLESGAERLDPPTRTALAELYGVDEPTLDACWQRGRDRLTADN